MPRKNKGKKSQEQSTEQSAAASPKVEETKVEEPKVVEAPKVEEPKVEVPKVEEPKVEEKVQETQVNEEPPVEDEDDKVPDLVEAEDDPVIEDYNENNEHYEAYQMMQDLVDRTDQGETDEKKSMTEKILGDNATAEDQEAMKNMMENMKKDPEGFKKMMQEMMQMSPEQLRAQEMSGDVGKVQKEMQANEREWGSKSYTELADKVSQDNVCYKNEQTLKEVTLEEIWPGEIEKNTIIWLDLVNNSTGTIVTDKAGKQAIALYLYNQFYKKPTWTQLRNIFPIGLKIGLKNPYLKEEKNGQVYLRNDNPQNVVFQNKKLTAEELKLQAGVYFQDEFYLLAVEYYQLALQKGITDPKLNVAVLGNMSQCFLKLNSYSKAIEQAEKALKIDENHYKCLLRKAKSFALLGDFKTSLKFFEFLKKSGVKVEQDIKELFYCIEQSQGDYKNIEELEWDSQYILNHAKKIQCKNTKDGKGRGIFAKEDIQKGELIIVEKAIASIKVKQDQKDDQKNMHLAKKCVQIAKLGDIQALRINQLYDGMEKQVPQLDFFIKNDFKVNKKQELSYTQIENIVKLNSIHCQTAKKDGRNAADELLGNLKTKIVDSSMCLFGMVSLINHSKNANLVKHFPAKRDDVIMVYAQRNINKGEELLHDYVSGVKDKKRVAALDSQWGITE